MKLTFFLLFSGLLYPLTGLAKDMLYCPQNNGYIKLGMTDAEVIAACGQPLSRREGGNTVVRKVPVRQMVYTTINPTNFAPLDDWGGVNNIAKQWSLPTGTSKARVEVNVMNGEVSSIKLNGTDTNALTICEGGQFQMGDPESMVLQACGSPVLINETYINQPVPSNENPEIWVYKPDQFQPPITLTIINSKLQSID